MARGDEARRGNEEGSAMGALDEMWRSQLQSEQWWEDEPPAEEGHIMIKLLSSRRIEWKLPLVIVKLDVSKAYNSLRHASIGEVFHDS